MSIEWTEEQLAKISEAIDAHTTKAEGVCPMCGTNGWSIGAGLVDLQIHQSPQPGVLRLGGPAFPCVALICDTCGNTVLMNVFHLGLGDYLGLKAAERPKPPPPGTAPLAEVHDVPPQEPAISPDREEASHQ